MATITNKTTAPLTVPLPGGKKLWLAPNKSGEISVKAVEHPALQKLVADGKIEVLETGHKPHASGGAAKKPKPSSGGPGQGGLRHTGDR